MPGTPEYERSQIDALLSPKDRAVRSDMAIYLCPQTPAFDDIYVVAVRPALRASGVISLRRFTLFDSDSLLSEICERLQTSELLLFDLTYYNPHVMYVLGLAHALRRCPLLLAQKQSLPLPFDLGALRCIEYDADREGLYWLRDNLTRAIRVHLAGVRGPDANQDVA